MVCYLVFNFNYLSAAYTENFEAWIFWGWDWTTGGGWDWTGAGGWDEFCISSLI